MDACIRPGTPPDFAKCFSAAIHWVLPKPQLFVLDETCPRAVKCHPFLHRHHAEVQQSEHLKRTAEADSLVRPIACVGITGIGPN